MRKREKAVGPNGADPFFYRDNPEIMTLRHRGETWYRAKDVIAYLGLPWNGHALRVVRESDKARIEYGLDYSDGREDVSTNSWFLTEHGVWRVALHSNREFPDHIIEHYILDRLLANQNNGTNGASASSGGGESQYISFDELASRVAGKVAERVVSELAGKGRVAREGDHPKVGLFADAVPPREPEPPLPPKKRPASVESARKLSETVTKIIRLTGAKNSKVWAEVKQAIGVHHKDSYLNFNQEQMDVAIALAKAKYEYEVKAAEVRQTLF